MLLDKEIIEISKKNSKKMLAILQHDNEPELTEVFGKAYIKCNQKRNLALDVGIRGHHIPIDEPERAGGSDTGPTPVELLLAALGGCMEINWIFLCSLSKLDVTSVEIEVSGKWDRRYALGGSKAPKAKLSEVVLDIKIYTTEPEAKFNRILEKSIDMCPVGGSLDSSIKKVYNMHLLPPT